GTRAHPGVGIETLAEREELARDRLGAVELHRRLHAVAQREFGAGGEADAAAHRREEIAALGVEHRMVEHRLAGCAVVHVVAALHRERQVVTEAARHHVRPRTERDHGVARLDPSLGSPYAPSALETAGVALHEPAAELFEELQV